MPTVERFEPIVKVQPWGREVLVARTDHYTGKVLERGPEGQRAGLQIHPNRGETFHLYSGAAYVYFDRGDGIIERVRMSPGESFHVPPGTVHSVETIGTSVMFEASVPDDTEPRSVPVEAKYRDQMRALGASPSVQDP